MKELSSVERWREYENGKQLLRQLNLAPAEYEEALRELARRCGI